MQYSGFVKSIYDIMNSQFEIEILFIHINVNLIMIENVNLVFRRMGTQVLISIEQQT